MPIAPVYDKCMARRRIKKTAHLYPNVTFLAIKQNGHILFLSWLSIIYKHVYLASL